MILLYEMYHAYISFGSSGLADHISEHGTDEHQGRPSGKAPMARVLRLISVQALNQVVTAKLLLGYSFTAPSW